MLILNKQFRKQFNSSYKAMIAVVVVNLVIIAVFGGLGYLIDLKFDTKPIFLIVLIAISFPFAQIVLYYKLKEILAKDLGLSDNK